MPPGGLSVDGSVGTDSLIVTGTTGDDTATVNSNTVTFNSSVITYSAMESIIVNGNGGTDALTQTAQPANPATLAFNRTATGGPSATDTLTVNAGTYTFPTPAAGNGTLPISLASLSITGGAAVVLPTAAAHADRWVLTTSSLTLTGATSKLDLGGNDLVLHNPDAASADAALTAVLSELTTGYGNGTWTGVGISSSAVQASNNPLLTLGAMLNNGVYINFDNQAVDANDVLVKFTYFGDVNLDGQVDGLDYTLMDNAFNTQGASLAAQIAAPPTAWPVAAITLKQRAKASPPQSLKVAAATASAASVPLASNTDPFEKDLKESNDVLDRLVSR